MEVTLFKIIDICQSNHIEATFIRELQQNGLIEITVIEDQEFVQEEQVAQIEKYHNWHYSLELNVQGIEIVQHLIHKIEILQHELKNLKQMRG